MAAVMQTPESSYLPSGRSSPVQRPIASGRSTPSMRPALRHPAKTGKPFPGSWAEWSEDADGFEEGRRDAGFLDDDDDYFDPEWFEGEWHDGWHNIGVEREENTGGRRGATRLQFIATMRRPGKPDKKFRISQGRRGYGRMSWSCGNGRLLACESCQEGLVWATDDGRESEWTKVLPDEETGEECLPNQEHAAPAGCFGNDPVWRPPQPVMWVAAAVPPGWGSHVPSGDLASSDAGASKEGLAGLNAAAIEFVPSSQGLAAAAAAATETVVAADQSRSKTGGADDESQAVSTMKSMDGLAKIQVPRMQAPIERMSGGTVTPNKLSPREFYSMNAADKEESPEIQSSHGLSKIGMTGTKAPIERMTGGNTTPQHNTTPMSSTPNEGMSPAIQPSQSPFFHPLRSPAICSPGGAHLAMPRSPGQLMRVGRSPNFRPARSPNVSNRPSRSPMMRSAMPPKGMASPQVRPAPPPRPEINILEGQTQDLKALAGGKVEWSIPEAWLALKDMPRDKFVSSPAFGVRRAKHMVLNFYPNGSRTAEEGQCTVELSRGPDCAGVKFELLLNGRNSGPKACISRRFHRDWKRPTTGFKEETNGGEVVQHVIVGLQLLEVFGGEGS